MSRAVALEARGLGAHYGTRHVLADVSFELEAGDLLGVIGPNGAGKTTLLKLLAGVMAPTSGEVALLGEPLNKLTRKQVARTLAVVPAEVRSAFEFSAGEIVLMGRHPHWGLLREPGADDRRAVREAMERTRTDGLEGRSFEELSSGERQRVVLAQALAQEPRVLLLDEPTTHLDLAHRIQLLDLIKELVREKGLATVLVSHDLNLASEYADRIALLEKGRLRRLGTPEEVLDYELIEEVYQTIVVVKTNPISGRPHVVPVSRWSQERDC